MKSKGKRLCSALLATGCTFGCFSGLVSCGKDSDATGEKLELCGLGANAYEECSLIVSNGEFACRMQENGGGYEVVYFDIHGTARTEENGEYILKPEEISVTSSVLGKNKILFFGDKGYLNAFEEMRLFKTGDVYVLGDGAFFGGVFALEEDRYEKRLLSSYTVYGCDYDIYLPLNTSSWDDEEFIVHCLSSQGMMSYCDGYNTVEPSYTEFDISVDISTPGEKTMTVAYEGKTYSFSCYVCESEADIPLEILRTPDLHVSMRSHSVPVGTTLEEFLAEGGVSLYIYDYMENRRYEYEVEDFSVEGWDTSVNRSEMTLCFWTTIDGKKYYIFTSLYVCNEEDLDKGYRLSNIEIGRTFDEDNDEIMFVEKGTELLGEYPLEYYTYRGGWDTSTGTVIGYDKNKIGLQEVEIYCEEVDYKQSAYIYVYDEGNIIPGKVTARPSIPEDVMNDVLQSPPLVNDLDTESYLKSLLTFDYMTIDITYCDGSSESFDQTGCLKYFVDYGDGEYGYYYHPVTVGTETYYYQTEVSLYGNFH